MSKLNILKHLTILYADDDEYLLESTSKTLELLFGQVLIAKDGSEAISIIKNNKNINIAMLDVKMGLISGIDVAKEIRNINENMPIFFVSSYTEIKDMIEACKLNLIEYVKKPFTFSQLMNIFEECLIKLQKSGLLFKKINDDILFDTFSMCLIKNDERIQLTKNETDILNVLLNPKGQIVTYEYISNLLGEVSDAGIKNTVLRLRKKLGTHVIKNVSKVGYALL